MTTPLHEEELLDIGGPNGGRIVAGSDGRILADEVEDDAVPLFLAASAMARALLVDGVWRGGLWHVHHCTAYNVPENCAGRCTAARAALKKAGVLP